MKKFILILIVSLFSILFLPGCGNKISENSDEQQIQENVVIESEIQNNDESRQDNTSKSEPQNTDYLKSYASVLSVYRNFANDYDAKRIDNERYMVAPWLGIGAMSLKNANWGSAFKDLNNNGQNELLLLAKDDDWENSDAFVSAIYSLVDGKPKLLDSFHYRYFCNIGKDNFIYTFGSNSAVEHECARCTITHDGTAIKVLEKIESEYSGEISESDESTIKYYYSAEDVEKSLITRPKFEELEEQMLNDSKQNNLEFIKIV